MAKSKVLLDLNNAVFQENLFALDINEAKRVFDTLSQVKQLDWDQLYKSQGLKWEKIISVKPPKGVAAIYSLRITQGKRATAIRDGDFIRFLTIEPDHDSTYGKK
jgi:hypothetical protein